jgi:hypothetical protein
MNAQAKEPGGCMKTVAVIALIMLAILAVEITINTKGIALPFLALIVYSGK